LLRHPYLEKEQVSAIVKYRDKNGSFQNLLQLKSAGLIDSETFLKVRPYMTCR
jgi:DNA uptake protein ComE-like DNA-binding protein